MFLKLNVVFVPVAPQIVGHLGAFFLHGLVHFDLPKLKKTSGLFLSFSESFLTTEAYSG